MIRNSGRRRKKKNPNQEGGVKLKDLSEMGLKIKEPEEEEVRRQR